MKLEKTLKNMFGISEEAKDSNEILNEMFKPNNDKNKLKKIAGIMALSIAIPFAVNKL